jgi:hypothetical protein
MLLEDYFSYSNLTRKSLVNFAESVASVKIELVRDEIKHLEQINTEDISDYLLFTAVDELQLNIDDREFINERLKTFSDDVYQRIKRIVKFYNNYYRVYVKYKHILSAIIGIYGITNNREITSEIYIRDYKNEPATYVIPVHLGVLEYYERIKEDIITVFETLIFVYINHLQNIGRPFLIPSGYFIPDNEKQRWYNIANNTNFLTVIDPNLRLNVDLGSEDKQKMQELLPEDFIFKLDRDILMKDRRITGNLQ